MAVFPNAECEAFCYWMLNVSWQQLTPPRSLLITTIYNASVAGTSVTDTEWNNFTQVTSWRNPFYLIYRDYIYSELPASTLYFNQLTGTVSDAFKKPVNTYIGKQQISGNWWLHDRQWIFGAENQQNARISLNNPTATAITENGGIAWTANVGYQPDGVNDYLNTNYNTITNANQFNLNSGCMWLYITSNVQADTWDMGNLSATTANALRGRAMTGNPLGALNSAGSIGNASGDSLGLLSVVRTGPTTMSVYKNGVLLVGGANASLAIPNLSVFICSINNAGAPLTFSTRQVSMAGIGSGSIDQTKLYTEVQTLADAIGFGV